MTHGFSTILERLASTLNINFKMPIASICDNGEKVVLTARNGDKIEGDRCLVTVPLGKFERLKVFVRQVFIESLLRVLFFLYGNKVVESEGIAE